MTTKELLALVGKWRERSDKERSGPVSFAMRTCADELAPIATTLAAHIAQQDATIARLTALASDTGGRGVVELEALAADAPDLLGHLRALASAFPGKRISLGPHTVARIIAALRAQPAGGGEPMHPSGRPYASKSEMKRVEVLSTPPESGGQGDGYYLASFKHKGSNSPGVLWWGPNNAGYSTDLEQAGIYTELTPGYHDSEHTVPVPVSFINGLRVRRIVDPGDGLNSAFWNAAALRAAITQGVGNGR